MRIVRIVIVSALLLLPVIALARVPVWTPRGAAHAAVRYSWRMSVSAPESCRARTQAELEALPVHMRTPTVCTRDAAGYTLVTRVDDATADTVPLLRGGLKGDRPLFVLRQQRLPAGQHRLRVTLLRATTKETSLLAALDTVLTFVPGGVQMITLDAEGQRLVARSTAAE